MYDLLFAALTSTFSVVLSRNVINYLCRGRHEKAIKIFRWKHCIPHRVFRCQASQFNGSFALLNSRLTKIADSFLLLVWNLFLSNICYLWGRVQGLLLTRESKSAREFFAQLARFFPPFFLTRVSVSCDHFVFSPYHRN